MRHFRIKTRILNLPSCPDWRRKGRVGNLGDEDADEITSEWEMEQSALDNLAYKRQTSLARLSDECIQLQKELAEEDIAVLMTSTAEFRAASKSLDKALWPPPVFRNPSGLTRQSQSLQNLSQQTKPMPKSILHHPGHDKIQAQRLKKLGQLRQELEDFATVNNLAKGGLSPAYGTFSRSQSFQDSNIGLVFSDPMENGKHISEIAYRIQKCREKELLRARREVQLLEHKLYRKNGQASDKN